MKDFRALYLAQSIVLGALEDIGTETLSYRLCYRVLYRLDCAMRDTAGNIGATPQNRYSPINHMYPDIGQGPGISAVNTEHGKVSTACAQCGKPKKGFRRLFPDRLCEACETNFLRGW